MMQPISELRPFRTELSFCRLPAARIIGMETRSGGPLGNTAPALWEKVFSCGMMETLMKLPRLIENASFGWTMEYDAASDTFVYMVCVLTPADTPVPDGCTFRDLSETDCACGLFGEDTMTTVSRAKEAGWQPSWEKCGWNAELYFTEEEQNPPKSCDTPWRWLVPVKKA